ncbi:MAG: pirin family protein [Chlorobi bacterium]|nr:pirin family protein [Chlorobiota bacterium]MCI0716623.1 pirin family protein [Chlorobiota bacterium]
MPITIYPFEQQEPGGFNDGEILENRPIVMSHNPAHLLPYSNLFYWAHAWSDNGSTIGEHPHKAFEIMTFILKGTIEHYDTKNRKWIPLNAGDAQLIRAGSGISHSEKLNAGSHVFQIWFDPDVRKTMSEPASYNDYSSNDFPVASVNGFTVKTFVGPDAPVEMESPGIKAVEISFKEGPHKLSLSKDKISSLYLIEGEIKTGDKLIKANDFAVIKDEDSLEFESNQEGKLFLIESPVKLEYKTYAEF